MKTAKVLIFILIIGWLGWVLLKTILGNVLLKDNGVCVKALLINEQNRVRSHKATLLYQFMYKNKVYEGNSLEEDLTKVGDSVCIVYLQSFPSINRPVKYFGGKIICNEQEHK